MVQENVLCGTERVNAHNWYMGGPFAVPNGFKPTVCTKRSFGAAGICWRKREL